MFASMKLKQRLLAGFGAVAFLLLLVAAIGLNGTRSINRQAEFATGNLMVGLQASLSTEASMLEMRRALLNHALSGATVKAEEERNIDVAKGKFRDSLERYRPTIFDPKERALFERIEKEFEALVALQSAILEASRNEDIQTVISLLDGEHKQIRGALRSDIEALAKINTDAAEQAGKDAAATYSSAFTQLALISLIGVALAIVLGLQVTRSVLRQLGGDPADAALAVRRIADGDLDVEVLCDRSHPSLLRDMAGMRDKLRAFADAQIEMQRQHEAGEIDFRIDSKAFTGAYARMADGVNEIAASHLAVQRQLVELVDEYAIGDLRRDMPALPGKKAAITAAMHTTKRNLASINGDIQRMVRAASEGDFSARGDEQAYQHAFREMVAGLNRLMDTANTGLSDVGRVLKALAEGDLTQQITAHYQGAFGELAANTNQTVSSISGIVRQISEAVETINTAASEIATGNADLSTRTESQAASLEETASSMEELTATVRQNAENTRQAEKVAEDATLGARRGGQVVADVVQTMDRITAASRKIGDIISVIDGIAFQTNILALNAAVEAARAGDQGRGFAVVASEVRSLAQRSAEAAKEIKGLIDTSTQTVNEGAHLVDQAGNEIRALVESVAKVTEIMKDISAATEEQRAGIEQVNETVMHLDQSTQQNAALVEEATASARSLEDQAGGLSQAVGRFRLAGDAISLRTLNAATKSHRSAEPVHAARRPRTTSVPQPKKIAVAAGKVDNNWDEF